MRRARVADVMHQGIIACPPETPLRSVAGLLAEHRIHAVFVSGEWQREGYDELVWGVIFDSDVVAAAGEAFEERTAGDLAHGEMVTIRPEAPLAAAARLMRERRVSHVVVVDAPLEPIGMVSTLDIAAVLARGDG